MANEIEELRGKRAKLQETLSTVFTEAKEEGGYNFRKVDCLDEAKSLEGYEKSTRVAEIVQAKTAELNDISKKLESLEAAAKAAEEFNRPASNPLHPAATKSEERKTLGERIAEHPVFKSWLNGSRDGVIQIDDFGFKELKTLFETGAGWAPESTRTGTVIDAVTRPIQIMDIMPTAQTGQANVVYMEETTRTHAAAEVAEGVAVPESTFALTEKYSPVREIGDSIPVTDIQLEDVPFVQSYLDSRLRFGVQQRLDGQIVTGNGTAPNLRGILNTTGIQTQAKGTDPTPDALFKAGTLIRVNGRAVPTHLVIHPTNWEAIRLLRTVDGIYIFGNPGDTVGAERMWGWPVVQNESLTVGTALSDRFKCRGSRCSTAGASQLAVDSSVLSSPNPSRRSKRQCELRW